MKWLKLGVGVVAVLLAILAVVPFFITLNDYIPVIEKEISERIREPVSIDSLHAAALPHPHVIIDGITIGAADAEIKVGKLRLSPDLGSLLTDRKVIRSVVVDDLLLSPRAAGNLIALTQRDAGGSGGIRVERLRLRGAVLKLERASFGPFDAEVDMGGSGDPGEVSLTTRDGALKAKVTPQGERYVLQIAAKGWMPPLNAPVRFDELDIKGEATHIGMELNEISAKLYGGMLSGKLSVTWEKGVSVKGAFSVNRVELRDAAALLSQATRVTGKLDAKPVFSARAANASQLAEALRLETPLTVHNGVLHGFDIVSAATALLKQDSGGGQTRFETLSGHLVSDRGTHRFTQLRIVASGLAARGHVTISPGKTLSGQLTANVKGAAAVAAVPLTVAGTVEAPLLYPSTSAILGAAVGTTVLGPGLGTAAGVKLGEFAGGLVGRKK